MIYVVTANSSTHKNDFGGTPQRLISGFFENGVEARGLKLSNWRTSLLSTFWRIWRVITFRKPTGWQFSKFALRLRSCNLDRQISSRDVVISFFPLVESKKCSVIIYTDITLGSLYETYPETFGIPNDIKKNSIKKEIEIYNRSNLILVASLECKNEIVEMYGIPEQKVYFLPLSPNISLRVLDGKVLFNRIETVAKQFNILFIGKDSYRKGLDRALQVRDYLLHSGIDAVLHIVGLDNSYPFIDSNPGSSHYYGFQSNDSPVFLELLEKSHLGLLLSRSDATGIALLEFQAAGLPTLVSGVGGMKSFIFSKAVKIVELDKIEEESKSIANSIREGSFKYLLSQGLEESNKILSWKRNAAQILDLCN